MTRTITGLRIRERRRELGIKQVELARRLGVSPSYLNLIERNKRGIGGALLATIGRELSLTLEQLDGSAERRLREQLTNLASDPKVGDPQVELSGTDEFLARFPAWARCATAAHRGFLDATAKAEALADRLAHDPELAEAVHAMLTEITALRSTAEIIVSMEESEGAQRRRFEAIVLDQSKRLSKTAGILAAYFEPSTAQGRGQTPLGDAEAFLERRAGALVSLEATQEPLRASLLAGESDLEAALRRRLPESLLPRLERTAGRNARLDHLARAFVEHHAGAEVAAVLATAASEVNAEAAVFVREELLVMLADALRLPCADLLSAGHAAAWDLEALIRAQDEDSALVCRRIAYLGSRGAPRSAHVEMDFSGQVLRRRGALDLLPGARELECPLWPAHQVRGDAPKVRADFLTLSGGEERLALALGRPRTPRVDMLVIEARDARKTIYGDLLSASLTAVGSTCRLCTHRACPWRREPAVIAG